MFYAVMLYLCLLICSSLKDKGKGGYLLIVDASAAAIHQVHRQIFVCWKFAEKMRRVSSEYLSKKMMQQKFAAYN